MGLYFLSTIECRSGNILSCGKSVATFLVIIIAHIMHLLIHLILAYVQLCAIILLPMKNYFRFFEKATESEPEFFTGTTHTPTLFYKSIAHNSRIKADICIRSIASCSVKDIESFLNHLYHLLISAGHLI